MSTQTKLIKEKRPSNEPRWAEGISSGSTVLNLACTDRPHVAFLPDYFYVWCGRSGSGKTFNLLQALAEASINPRYDNHRLIFDNGEDGALMSIQKFYGKALARRLEPPVGTRDKPEYSNTLESLYHNVHNALKVGPCIYLRDSMDPLPTDNELKEFLKKNRTRKEKKKAEKEGILLKEVKEPGSYGTERARVNSHHLRLTYNDLQGSGSLLFVIFQARQNIGIGSQFNPDTRGGGTAPTYYAGLELWSKVARHIKTKYKGKPVEQGVLCDIRIKKGRITGKDRSVQVPIYHSYGIDDIGGCINFLTEWKHWKKSGDEENPMDGKIEAGDFNFTGGLHKLANYIEEKGLEKDLRALVADVWQDIEDACAIQRKRRYP